ncbi:MAG: SbcC/MukB-like Walker B domain-containing protein [Eggerthellaceae bacterium]
MPAFARRCRPRQRTRRRASGADLARSKRRIRFGEERLEEAACRECAVNSLKNLEERSRAKASASRECWNALVAFRRERSSAVSSEQIDETDRGNEAWDREWCALETSVIPERRALFERMEAETKEGFTTAIVGALRNGIVDVRRTIRETNAYLSECPFGDIRYRFDCSKNIDYAPYYDMIMDPDFDNALGGLWDDEFHAKHGAVIDSFFDTSGTAVAPRPSSSAAGARPQTALLDYKLSEFRHERGASTEAVSLKPGLGGSSGGEQMLPFYVVLFASAGIAAARRKGPRWQHAAVLIDEAFEVVTAAHRQAID